MQVLCQLSNTASDVRCKVCGQGFVVYWSRTSQEEQELARRSVVEVLELQHATSSSADVHPKAGFNVPEWSGLPRFSGAALLGGAENWSI
jgi:hypothetical protein